MKREGFARLCHATILAALLMFANEPTTPGFSPPTSSSEVNHLNRDLGWVQGPGAVGNNPLSFMLLATVFNVLRARVPFEGDDVLFEQHVQPVALGFGSRHSLVAGDGPVSAPLEQELKDWAINLR